MREDIKDSKNQKIGWVDRGNGLDVVFDRTGRKLGSIRKTGHRLTAYDQAGRELGYWDEPSNTTYGRPGQKIDKGNLLLDLIMKK